MDAAHFAELGRITEEERSILEGRTTIDRALYMGGSDNTINARKLLAAGKLDTLRSHTRFIHFPEHTHDYVEMVYMCAGATTHIVGGAEICLRQRELLFLMHCFYDKLLKLWCIAFIGYPFRYSKIPHFLVQVLYHTCLTNGVQFSDSPDFL